MASVNGREANIISKKFGEAKMAIYARVTNASNVYICISVAKRRVIFSFHQRVANAEADTYSVCQK